MSEEKPLKVYVPTPPETRKTVKPIDYDLVRIGHDVEPLPPPRVNRPPAVTQTKTVTTTGSVSEDVAEYILPHGKKLIDEMLALAFSKSTKDTVKVQVINSLLDRGFGRPTQKSESVSTVADLTSLHLDALRNASK